MPDQEFDLCVIGGGATGAGCALDAQLRGLRTLLVEAGDFASRTSSASTKMVHGGIRYLQAAVLGLDLGQYRLVEHALHERAVMIANAPHLARKMEFVVPCFSLFERFFYGAGMKMYDWVAGSGSLTRSRLLDRDEVIRRVPAVVREQLEGGASYADGQFDDARYCLALILTFLELGGTVRNYTRAIEFEKDSGGKIAAVVVEDQLSGDRTRLKARAVVNATGPYADSVRRMAQADAAPRMRPSKGVHILFPLGDDWTGDGLLVPKTEDGRVIFALPFNGRLLVGTTDDEATAETPLTIQRSEIDYLLRQIQPYLREPLTAEQVVSGFAGIRPLVASDRSSTAELIRDDEVEINPGSGLISILGGKWTTYRLMAERTIDQVAPEIPSVTRSTRLVGGRDYDEELWQELAGVSEATARHLARKYGTEARRVLALAQGDLRNPLVDGAAPIGAEVVWAARHEMARSVEDVLTRRTGLEFYDWRLAREAAPVVSRLLQRELGESEFTAAEPYQARIDHLLRDAGLN